MSVCVCCWDMNWAPAGLIPNGLQHCLQNIADLKEKGQKIRDNRQDWGDTKYTASWDSTAVVMLEPFFQLQMHQTCFELMLMKMLRDHTWSGITSEYAEDFCMRLYIIRFIYIIIYIYIFVFACCFSIWRKYFLDNSPKHTIPSWLAPDLLA